VFTGERLKVFSMAAVFTLVLAPAGLAKSSPYPDSNLSVELQGQLSKAVKGFKNKKFSQATSQVESVAAQAGDTAACLSIVSALDSYGAPAAKAKRACLEKGLNLAKTPDELLNVALKARYCECFDISKAALDGLVGATKDFEALIDIAHKAHQASVQEVAQVAMQKAYTLVSNVPDALLFAREAHSIGLDNMSHTALKDLIEDQNTTDELMALVPKVAVYDMVDLTRLTLKRGLEKCKTVEDYLAVYNNAKRFEQEDIVKLAAYRGRKLTLINKIKDEREGPMRAREKALEEKERKSKEEMMRATGQTPSGF